MKYLIFVSGSTTESSHSKTLENPIGLGRPLLGSGDGWDGQDLEMENTKTSGEDIQEGWSVLANSTKCKNKFLELLFATRNLKN